MSDSVGSARPALAISTRGRAITRMPRRTPLRPPARSSTARDSRRDRSSTGRGDASLASRCGRPMCPHSPPTPLPTFVDHAVDHHPTADSRFRGSLRRPPDVRAAAPSAASDNGEAVRVVRGPDRDARLVESRDRTRKDGRSGRSSWNSGAARSPRSTEPGVPTPTVVASAVPPASIATRADQRRDRGHRSRRSRPAGVATRSRATIAPFDQRDRLDLRARRGRRRCAWCGHVSRPPAPRPARPRTQRAAHAGAERGSPARCPTRSPPRGDQGRPLRSVRWSRSIGHEVGEPPEADLEPALDPEARRPVDGCRCPAAPAPESGQRRRSRPPRIWCRTRWTYSIQRRSSAGAIRLFRSVPIEIDARLPHRGEIADPVPEVAFGVRAETDPSARGAEVAKVLGGRVGAVHRGGAFVDHPVLEREPHRRPIVPAPAVLDLLHDLFEVQVEDRCPRRVASAWIGAIRSIGTARVECATAATD